MKGHVVLCARVAGSLVVSEGAIFLHPGVIGEGPRSSVLRKDS
jgi:hypothetical protein